MKKALSSFWFLSLVITLPVIAFLPPLFTKYILHKEQVAPLMNGLHPIVYFTDLDSDGEKERVESFMQGNRSNVFSFQFYTNNGGMVDQINWPGPFNPNLSSLFFADADRDGHQEIYSFMIQNDSLFLRWIQVTPEIGPISILPVCPVYTYRDSLYSYSIGAGYCADLDCDGQQELVFSVVAGFSIIPRKLVKVNIINREISASQVTGCSHSVFHFHDLNGDGKLEIIAEGEVPPIRKNLDLPYNDPAPFLRLLDSDLNDLFPPVKFFEGISSITRTFPVEIEG